MNSLISSLPNSVGLAIGRATARLRSALLGPKVTAVLAETERGRFLVDPADPYVGGSLRLEGVWSPGLLEVVSSRVNSDSRVLFVGAHVGSFVIPLARKIRSAVALEAHPQTYRLLELNLLLNRVTNVVLHRVAAAEFSGVKPFILDSANPGHSRLADEKQLRGQDESVPVPCSPVDRLLENDHFDFVIIDVEGAELAVLKGMAGLLTKRPHLVLEVMPEHHNDFGAYLSDLHTLLAPNYETFSLIDEVHPLGPELAAAPLLQLSELLHLRFQGDILVHPRG